MTGQLLGDRYELVNRIGAGGMAEVWEAIDRSLGRSVAVKLLHTHLAEDESILARFRSEAQAAARLTHPGIVSIYDTVTTAETDAIVMELVEGQDLRTVLDERGTLAIDDAIEVAIQVAHALGHAHQNDIVHRDVKPANIIVRPDRRVKLSDFGIAKALGDTTFTDSGSLVGTVKYLAPEQIEGLPVDGRTDLYSLSIVLYEMVCGEVPFPSTDLMGAMDRVKRVAPRARNSRRDIPVGLDEFLARTLSRDPADRPPDAKTYAASLAAVRRKDATTVSHLGDRQPGAVGQPGPAPVARPAKAPPRSIPMRTPSPPPANPSKRRRRRKRDLIWPLLAAILMIAALIIVWLLIKPAGEVVTDQIQGAAAQSSSTVPDDRTSDDVTEGTDGTDGSTAAPSTERSSSSSTTASTTTTTTIPFVSGVRYLAFDPFGDDGDEHNDKTGLALDGDPTTFWRTQRYTDGRTMGQKEGVGLIIEFDELTRVSGLTTLTNNPDWAGRLYEADEVESSLEAWGEPLAFYENMPVAAELEVPAMTTRAMLLWFTDLGQDDDEAVRLELFELTVVP